MVVVGAEEGGRCGDAPTDTDVEDALVSDDDDDDDDMTVKHFWDVTGTFDVSSFESIPNTVYSVITVMELQRRCCV